MAHVAEQLVGRVPELEILERSLAELERKRSSAVELLGEPGIGKTRMLAELGRRADARGHIVLAGSASELERELPFSVFVDALDDYVQALDPRRLDLLDDGACAELTQVLPSFPRAAGSAAAQGERFRTHRAVRQLLECVAATKPLVLLLDDLHWADDGSVELLGTLLRRPPAAAVLIALSVRPRQLPERLSAALERADRGGTLVRVPLAELSAAEAGELLGDAVGKAEAAALYEAAGGNPFYLQQLARAPGRAAAGDGAGTSLTGVEVPRAVAAALTEELALLPREARRLLEGAAVAGDPFEPELAAAAAGLPDGAAINGLDDLLARDLVRHTEVPRRFRFRHPLVRAAAYDAAPGGWRLGAHERCAAALAARGASAVERAHHVERSARHGDAAAIAILREAGAAIESRSPATAARLLGAAARLLPQAAPARVELLAALATAHMGAGQFAEALAVTREGLELLPQDALAPRIGLTAFCAGLENLLGLHAEAHARLLRALDDLPDQASAEAVTLTVQLAIDAFYRMDYAEMAGWARRACDAAAALDDAPVKAAAASIRALALTAGGAEGAAAAATDAAALVDELADDQLATILAHGADGLSGAELYLGRLERAAAHAERSLAVARATGRGQLLPVLYWAGMSRMLSGRLDDAARVFDAAVEIAQLFDHAEGVAWNMFGRSLAATAAGDVDTAVACGEEAVEAVRELDASYPKMSAAVALAAALLPAGDAPRAVELLLGAAGGDELTRMPEGARTAGFELLVRCWLALGRREEAAQRLRSRSRTVMPARRPNARWRRLARPRRPALPSRARCRVRWPGARSPRPASRSVRRPSCSAQRSSSAPAARCATATPPSASCAGSGTRTCTAARARARPAAKGSSRSPSASCRWRGSSSTAAPTPRSRPSCSSARRPSRRTCATCSTSWASPRASTSRVPSSAPTASSPAEHHSCT